MPKLFTPINDDREYTDWQAGANYRSDDRAVRFTLTHVKEDPGRWYIVVAQEADSQGDWELVFKKELTAAEALAFLAIEETR